jgi:hypothetical protein
VAHSGDVRGAYNIMVGMRPLGRPRRSSSMLVLSVVVVVMGLQARQHL